MTARRTVAALLLTLIVAGCASSGSEAPSEFAAAPDRVEQATWDEHCRFRRELMRGIDQYAHDAIDSEIFVVMLLRYREGLVRTAKSMPKLGNGVRELVFGIDRLLPAVREEARFNYSEIRAAVNALPACDKPA